MNKKIYFNNKFLEFTDSVVQESQNQSIRFYAEFDNKKLANLIEELLSETDQLTSKQAVHYSTSVSNFKQVLDYLKSNFYFIEAAGGLIKKQEDFLFIFRLGKWDLPKGKLDKGEAKEHAAVRECEEECAVMNLKIEQELNPTFHTYKYKKSYAIKQTYWYYMTTNYDKKLKPQVEENIEAVEWFSKEKIESIVFENSYFTIKDVVNEAKEKAIL